MFNDPFKPYEAFTTEKVGFWQEEYGRIFTYRHDTIIAELKKRKDEYGRASILDLQYDIDRIHEKRDKDSYEKYSHWRENRKVLLITTGGTILCKTNTKGFLAPVLTGTEIFARLNDYTTDSYNIIETVPFRELREVDRAVKGLSASGLIDSADMVSRLQLILAKHIAEQINKHKPLGVIVLHGTDTMANTAAALSLYFKELTVPIILTGAMIPPEKEKSDAFKNLKASIIFAAAAPIKPGVYVCFDNRLYPGTRVIHDASDPERAFRAIMRKEKGCVGKLNVGTWILKDLQTRKTEIVEEAAARGNKDPSKKGYYSPHRVTDIVISKDYLEKRTGTQKAEAIDLEEPGTSIGITTFPSTKRKIGMILGLFNTEEDIDAIAKRVYKEVGVDFIEVGKPFYKRILLKERKIMPLEERMGIVFRGFSGTVDDRIVIPLTKKGIPVVLGSRVRYDVVTNIGEKYATNTELVKAGVIYSEDMVEDMLAAKLSIVLGLLHERILKYKREDIIKDPEKYLYFVKLLMLMNFKGELMLYGTEGKAKGKILKECPYPIDIMTDYLGKNGFGVNPEKLFTTPDDYSGYFLYFRGQWLGEGKIVARERGKEIPKPAPKVPENLEKMSLEEVVLWVIKEYPAAVIEVYRRASNKDFSYLFGKVKGLKKDADDRKIVEILKEKIREQFKDEREKENSELFESFVIAVMKDNPDESRKCFKGDDFACDYIIDQICSHFTSVRAAEWKKENREKVLRILREKLSH